MEGGNPMVKIPSTAHGIAKLATEEEIQREQSEYYLASDLKDYLQSDTLDFLVPNVPEFGYTNPNLHRRIFDETTAPQGSTYPFVNYDADGNPYEQSVKLGVWDSLHSYRTTTTYSHDEESTTCEIP